MASTDYLTGVMNKRMFNEISEHYFKTAQKNNFNLTLLLLDLDHFKKVNDNYGHQAGDELLKYYVKSIQKLLNTSDIFARIGGEEFAILISQTSDDNAYLLAETIRQKTASLIFSYEEQNIYVTTSIGISEIKDTDITFEDVFSRADVALYQAKHEGRNKICFANFTNDNVSTIQQTKNVFTPDYSI